MAQSSRYTATHQRRSLLSYGILASILCCTGCATGGGAFGRSVFRLGDPQCLIIQDGAAYTSHPWWQRPSQNSLVAPVRVPEQGGPQITRSPLHRSTPTGDVTTADLGSSPSTPASRSNGSSTSEEEVRRTVPRTVPRKDQEEETPTLTPIVIPAPLPGTASKGVSADLKLEVRSPARGSAGAPILYQLRVENTTSRAIEDVVVRCEFDAGLNLPGKSELTASQKLQQLKGGEVREIELTLIGNEPGRKQCRFTVQGEGVAPVPAVSRSIELGPRQLSLDLSGPGRGREGHRIFFELVLRNPSAETVKDLTIQLTSAKEMVPLSAEGTPQQTAQGWKWTIPELKAEETRKFQLVLTCSRAIETASMLVEGKAQGETLDRVEATVEILPEEKVLPQEKLQLPRLVPPDVELGPLQTP